MAFPTIASLVSSQQSANGTNSIIELSQDDLKRKEHFTFLTTQYKPVTYGEHFDVSFHRKMQNPENGVISFDGLSRDFLHNGNLSHLPEYFSKESGEHIYGKNVKQLIIINICLIDKIRNDFVEMPMPDGTPYICYLLEKNPKIEQINLTSTKLKDKQALLLLNALNTNTRLLHLSLKEGNDISPEILEKIENKLQQNRNSPK